MSDDEKAPGWDAIDAALEAVHGEREPKHFARPLPIWLGGEEPFQGISNYAVPAAEDAPAHWYIVSYGMTELFEKDSDEEDISGFGFEFTMRVTREDADDEPPAWAMNMMSNLGRYVWRTGNAFDVGHHLPLNGPIALGTDTKLEAVCFARDPQLGEVVSPHGAFTFLQMVGITMAELEAVQDWDAEKVIALIAQRDPMLLTDLNRACFLEEPDFARSVREGAARDGSSTAMSFSKNLFVTAEDDGVHLELGALYVGGLRRGLLGRVPFGNTFWLHGSDVEVTLQPGEEVVLNHDDGSLHIELPAAAARALGEQLAPKRGEYRTDAVPGLRITVVPSNIYNPDGTVAKVVG